MLKTTTGERRRSLFKVPVFQADVSLDASFNLTGVPDALPQGAVLDWNRAEMIVGVSDTRGALSNATLTVGGKTLTLVPAQIVPSISIGVEKGLPIYLTLIGTPAVDFAKPGREFNVTSALRFSGAQRIAVLSYGKTTQVFAQGDWPSPGFDGGFLPVKRSVSKQGFSAEWSVAEVLLQRTQADVVGRMFPAFVAKFPSWKRLATCSQSELEEILKPLGLWKRRSASLRELSEIMATRRGRYPKERDQIEQLPGVGQYISNAILMFDQGQCQPLLDVNLARVLERVFGPRRLSDIRYDPYLQTLAMKVVAHTQPSILNWAFLDLASLICTIRSPKCPVCPLVRTCCFAQSKGTTNPQTSSDEASDTCAN